MNLIILILVTLAAILGPSIVVAFIGKATIQALSRNPSSSPIIMMGMATILIFNQCLIIVSLLVFFQLLKQY
ncbi:MAG: hypothetical protein KC649_03470 [Candidatus Omnitrophica bacterium]|nr:hypothetical protein [Candidatus Omnitrophota bacterium]